MIWWKIYTRSNPPCKFCKDAKELLDLYGIDYYEIDIDETGVREMFKERGFKTVPQVFRENQYIGGFTALEKYLKDEQIGKEIDYKAKGKGTSYHSA